MSKHEDQEEEGHNLASPDLPDPRDVDVPLSCRAGDARGPDDGAGGGGPKLRIMSAKSNDASDA